MFKSLSARVLLGLALGLAAGVLINLAGAQGWIRGPAYDTLVAGAHVVEAFGGLWLNALRMTVVPLVFALLVTGIASVADAMATGRLAVRAVMLFARCWCSPRSTAFSPRKGHSRFGRSIRNRRPR